MDLFKDMLRAHPRQPQYDLKALDACIKACYDCSTICVSCADACLSEAEVFNLISCITMNQNCADICRTTGNILTRLSNPNWELIKNQIDHCSFIADLCAEECGRHAQMHRHCKVCMEQCRVLIEACNDLRLEVGNLAL